MGLFDQRPRTRVVEPSSPEHARDMRQGLSEEVEAINAQLGNPNVVDPATGKRLSREEYDTWRMRALSAKTIKVSQIMRLNEYLRKVRRDESLKEAGLEGAGPEELLRRLYGVTRDILKDSGLAPTEEEQKVLDAVRVLVV